MAEPMTYDVDLSLDRAAWWVATVRGVRGCRTQGRSVNQALARVREAIAACGGDRRADIRPHILVPEAARPAVANHAAARSRLDREQQAARTAALEAVRELTQTCGLSVRDAGAVLGLSHQRVHQLSEEIGRAPKR